MRSAWRMLLLIGVLALAAPVLAVVEPTPEELANNRRLLEKWKADREHYARLREELKEFEALKPEQQAAMRQLDRELYQEDPVVQARLWRVLDRYATWLEKLPEGDRQKIAAAATPAERLQVVKEVREKEWVDRLPKAKRDQVVNTPKNKRAEVIAELREKERERRLEWQRVVGTGEDVPLRWPPTRVAELPPAVQSYVVFSLHPQLTAEEKGRLEKA
jgi:hypothetical protein